MKTLGQIAPPFEDFEQFCKEFDEGKHPLSSEDEEALKRARAEFMEELYRVITVSE